MTPQENCFELHFENAPFGVAIVLEESGFNSVNNALQQMLGYRREELLGKTFADIIHPDDFANETWSQCFSAGAPATRGNLRCIKKNREVLWVNLTAWPLRDPIGAHGRAMVTIEAVSERKQSEAELQTTITRLNEAQRLAGVGHWAVNPQTGLARWSDEVFRIFGRDPSLGAPGGYRDWREYFGPDDWAKFESSIQRLQRTGAPCELDVEIIRPGGERRWATLRGDREVDAAGVCTLIRGTVQDIAGSNLIERSLNANREVLDLFIEHAPAAMAMFDKDMRHIAASRRFLEMYSLEKRDIIGRSHYEIFPELPARLRDVHSSCLAGAEMTEDNEYFERADGTVQHTRWAVRPWRDAAGAIGGIILLVEDTTERMRDQARLRHSEAQLRTILDGVGACIYTKRLSRPKNS